MSDNVITINGKEHDAEKFSDNQKYLIDQIRDLQAKASGLKFQMDQVQIAHDGFLDRLIESLGESDDQTDSPERSIAN